ncbi:MAG: acyltransferase domain-containing protein, partial [Enterobacter roggenkampii]
MGRELYETDAMFRREMDRCFLLVETHGVNLKSVLYPDRVPDESLSPTGPDLRKMLGVETRDEIDTPLDKPVYSHSAQFCVEYALARCLMDAGWQASAMIGDSLGEFVAACLADVFSLEEAIGVVIARARLIETLAQGGMLAVAMQEEDLITLLGEGCHIALKTAPRLCVVSGTRPAIDTLAQRLRQAGETCRLVANPWPLHSPLMSPIGKPLQQLLERVTLKAPQIPYLSNVTGRWIRAEEACDPGYWRRHSCETVRFSEGIELLLRDGAPLFVEIGAGNGLCSSVMQHIGENIDFRAGVTGQTLPGRYENDSAVERFGELKAWLEHRASSVRRPASSVVRDDAEDRQPERPVMRFEEHWRPRPLSQAAGELTHGVVVCLLEE